MMRRNLNVAILPLGIVSGALVGMSGAAFAGMNGYAMLSAALVMAPLSIGAALAVIALRAVASRAHVGLVAEIDLILYGSLAGGLTVGALEQAIGFPYYEYAPWVAISLGLVAVGSIVVAVIGARPRAAVTA